ASEGVKHGTLSIVPVKGMELSKTLYMIRSPDRPATRAQAAFWDLAFADETASIREVTDQAPARA
ncbi:hypothetical protein HQ535_06960, partial [bacterium]|nr:hypothetical protein [bacterium]